MAKTLLIYFSMTGQTEQVAQQMAEILGADLYGIQAAVAYTRNNLDWTSPKSRANLEQKNPTSRPHYQGKLPDMTDYDTVIFGHPIWWGIAPHPLYRDRRLELDRQEGGEFCNLRRFRLWRSSDGDR